MNRGIHACSQGRHVKVPVAPGLRRPLLSGAMRILRVDPIAPFGDAVDAAGQALRDGRLVAFPTETVYGLGAHALDPAAVDRIYAAKGRPAYNPIIVHVVDADAARDLTSKWPPFAEHLARAFWPGPLTI